MLNNLWIKRIAGLFKKVGIFYLFIFLIFANFTDYKKVIYKAKLSTLNRLRPISSSYLVEIEGRDLRSVDKKLLEKHEKYYKSVVNVLPTLPGPYGLLGYCQYYLGDERRSIDSFKKATALNSNIFSYFYNLGVIFYNQGRYEEAINNFKQAMSKNPAATVNFVYTSKVYLPILQDNSLGAQAAISKRIKQAYQYNVEMLVLSHYQLKQYREMTVLANAAISKGFDVDGEFYYLSGLAYYETRDYPQADQMLRECIKRNPQHAQAYHYYSLILRAAGQNDLASEFEVKSKHWESHQKIKHKNYVRLF